MPMPTPASLSAQKGLQAMAQGSGRMLLSILLILNAFPVSGAAKVRPDASSGDTPDTRPQESMTAESGKPNPVYLDRVIDYNEYKVGPGDRFMVNIMGETPAEYDVSITPEGTIVVPSVGVISVKGQTLAQARTGLAVILKQFFPKSTVSVSLIDVRRFRVAVTGAVKNPGLHIVTANTRATEAVKEAVPDEIATTRSIRLLRGGKDLRVDMVMFDRLGIADSNPYLEEGDVVNVPARNQKWGFIEIDGAVNAPDLIEFAEGDKVGDLIRLAYGLSPNADTTRLELWRFRPGESEARRVEWSAGATYSEWRNTSLMQDDRVIVRGFENYHEKLSVKLNGEVKRPGLYAFPKRQVSLREVIDSAGGFTPSADLQHATVVRTRLPDWLVDYKKRVDQMPVELRSRSENEWLSASALSAPGRVATDFTCLFVHQDTSCNVMLYDGDQVIVPRQSDYVNVIGRVAQPGLIALQPGADVTYYLQRAGGYAWRADRGGTFLVKGGTGTALKKGQIRTIDAGDILVVPTAKDKKFWSSVKETLIVASNIATIYLVIRQATR